MGAPPGVPYGDLCPEIVAVSHRHAHEACLQPLALFRRTMKRAVELTHDDLLVLHGAVVEAGLADARAALLVGINRATVASLPISTSLSAQILMDLDELNRMGQLADGSVPIVAWLKNAAQILGPRAEGVVVRH